jgi:Trk K+ transport system NAD-binding subunit
MVKHKLSVLSEDSNERIIIPSVDYKFTSNDLLVLFGADENIKKFKKIF